jgi:hypothetical protein
MNGKKELKMHYKRNKLYYGKYYNSIINKTNQIGFKCHPGEEATIYSVKVTSITEDEKSNILYEMLIKNI